MDTEHMSSSEIGRMVFLAFVICIWLSSVKTDGWIDEEKPKRGFNSTVYLEYLSARRLVLLGLINVNV